MTEMTQQELRNRIKAVQDEAWEHVFQAEQSSADIMAGLRASAHRIDAVGDGLLRSKVVTREGLRILKKMLAAMKSRRIKG